MDFRATDFLRTRIAPHAVPLIYPSNLERGYIRWPLPRSKKPGALSRQAIAENLTVPAGYYVLVKRFSAKEEKRRIVAAVFSPDRVKADAIGFENHLNYYHTEGHGMSLPLAKGLAAFLNSTIVDQYFRQFSGHTQVNATDLRKMRYPSRAKLIALGEKLGETFPDSNELDRLMREEIGLMPKDTELDPIEAKKRIAEAIDILRALNLPRAQLNDRSALTLLALMSMTPLSSWQDASDPMYGITEMMEYFKKHFGVTYAPNTRETVRRQTIHQFIQAGLVRENPDHSRPINSPSTRYQIEPSAMKLIQTFGTSEWEARLASYLDTVGALSRLRARERNMRMLPVTLPDGRSVNLSAAGQNLLIKQIVEEFCPRFTPGGVVVYLGDAGDKLQGDEHVYLRTLGVSIDKHDKMPDVIVHIPEKNWLVLIEAVTSHGPVDLKRRNELITNSASLTEGMSAL